MSGVLRAQFAVTFAGLEPSLVTQQAFRISVPSLPDLARDFLDRRAPGLADSRSAGTGFESLNRRRKFRIAECESQRMIDRRVVEWLALVIVGQRGGDRSARRADRRLLPLASEALHQIIAGAVDGRRLERDLADSQIVSLRADGCVVNDFAEA